VLSEFGDSHLPIGKLTLTDVLLSVRPFRHKRL
jgi:hypothetical protein